MSGLSVDLLDGRAFDLELGRELSGGGEGKVFEVVGLDGFCAKVFHGGLNSSRLESRLSDLAERFRGSEWQGNGQDTFSVASPIAICKDDGKAVGYIMRQLRPPAVPLKDALLSQSGVRRAGRVTWATCVDAAIDLARVVGRLNECGFIVADLCPDNLFVWLTGGRITLCDVDSFQFQGSDGHRYESAVIRGEYSRPKSLGNSRTRYKADDRFALGIVIGQILLEGVHPFAGVPKDIEEQSSGDDQDVWNIRNGRSWVLEQDRVTVPPTTLSARSVLPSGLLSLMANCYQGVAAGKAPPRPEVWISSLQRIKQGLQTCSANENHRFAAGLAGCPWCIRSASLGRDPFPSGRSAPTARGVKVAADLIVDHRSRLSADRQSLGLDGRAVPTEPSVPGPVRQTQVAAGANLGTAGPRPGGLAPGVPSVATSDTFPHPQPKAAQSVNYWPLTIVVLLGFIVAGFLFAAQPSADQRQDTVVGPQSTSTASATVSSSSDSSSAATSSELPADSLTHMRDADLPTVESYVGQWVPQLASIPSGDGDAQFLTTQESLGLTYGALVVSSDDFIFDNSGYWVSLAPNASPDAQGALDWCQQQGLGSDNCFARLITHDESLRGQTARM